MEKTLDKIVALAKNRGFVYPGSEIYGGLANTWDYGNLGVELKNNVKKAWWKKFIQENPYNVGVDCAILMNPQTWVASGHLGGFADPLMDCKECHERFRADKLIEDYMADNGIEIEGSIDGWTNEQMEQYVDYRNYLTFSMYEKVEDENGNIRKNAVDDMAGRDSGGEGQNPKYVALLAGFAMLYMQQTNRDSKIRLVLLDEAFSKMDKERSEVCLRYARELELQLIVCVPDERLQSLIRNVDCVYGFRRYHNQISMMHIDKGDYLKLMEGEEND